MLNLDWSNVITHPLGLVGFALFLLFTYWAFIRQPRWVTGLIALLATVVIVGGLVLAFQQTRSEQDKPQPSPTIQETTGDNSPAVQGVEGNVNIIIEQGSQAVKKK